MNHLKLIVGTDSTWSIRAALCLKIADIDYQEIIIDLGADSYRAQLKQHSETLLVPVLVDGNLKVHDSLGIAEYINELSSGALYPKSASGRAIARSLCAELHSGFNQLRSSCPFYLDRTSTAIMTPALDTELDRIKTIWSAAQGRFMFEHAGVIDAFYAVLAYRLASYNIQLDGKAGIYQRSLLDWDLLKHQMITVRNW